MHNSCRSSSYYNNRMLNSSCDAADPAAKCYRLAADCTLVECSPQDVQPMPPGPLEPCCVLPPAVDGGPKLYCGRYSMLPYDPAVWYCGSSTVLSLRVSEARKRMLRCRLLDSHWAPLYQPGAGMRPLLWEHSLQGGSHLQDHLHGGIAALEQHWHTQCSPGAALYPTAGAAQASSSIAQPSAAAAIGLSVTAVAQPAPQLPAQGGPESLVAVHQVATHAASVDAQGTPAGTSNPIPAAAANAAYAAAAAASHAATAAHAPAAIAAQPPAAGSCRGHAVAAYDASWMHPSRPRQLPLQRAAQRPPAPTVVGRARRPTAPVTDADPLHATEGQSTFKPVWRRLYAGNLLPREAVSVAWRVMHGQLYCGAFWARIRPGSPYLQACCKASVCVAQLETLSHMFMGCPCVSPACDWLLDVWQALSGVRPPRDARVILGDDDRVWAPDAPLGPVWQVLRVLYMHAVWRCCVLRRVANKPFTAAAVVAIVVRDVRRVLTYAWARTVNGTIPLPGVAVPSSVLARASRVSQFKEIWCHRGVLASVQGAGVGVSGLCLRLSSSSPVMAPV
jgi:hypothetical protein